MPQMCPNCSCDNHDYVPTCAYCGELLRGLLGYNTMLEGRYQVTRVLGCGGMGAVYLADDTRIQGRRVAVKENLNTTPQAQAQFQYEVSLMVRLNHPGLPDVSDQFMRPGGRQYMVMDYVEGETLEDVVGRRGPLPEAEVIALANQLLDVLEHLHSHSVIHRDVKPANVKITPSGKPVLVDLGIAKLHTPGLRTQSWARGFGSPGFAPLEQYGAGSTDARSDLYSLGAVMYFLLTDQVPPEAIGRVANQTQVPLPRQFNPAVSPQIERVIEKAMRLQAQDRYQSAREMRLELESLKPIPHARLEDLDTNLAQLLKDELSPASIKRGATRAKLRITNRGQGHLFGEVVVSKLAPWFSVPNPWIDCPPGQTVTVDIHIDPKKYSAWRDFSFKPIVIKRWPAQLPRPSPVAPPPPVYPPLPPPVAPDFQPPVDRLSMLLKPKHTGWTSYAQKHVIEDLILIEDLERLKSFIADSEGGRFVLTGYGRFGGTSLVKGAIERARRELQQRKLSEGALLVFNFNVRESSEPTGTFEVEANEFSFGKLTTQYEDIADAPGLAALKEHADRTEPFSITPQIPLTCHFSLTTPLDKSFFSRSGLTGLFSKRRPVREFDLVTELRFLCQRQRQ